MDAGSDALALSEFMAYSYYAHGNQASTIQGKVSAVCWFHLHECGIVIQQHPLRAATLRALHKLTDAPKPRHGLFLPAIMAGRPAAVAAGGTLLATWPGVLLCFYLLLRASECWARDGGLVHPDFCVLIGDVTFWRAGVELPLRYRHLADHARVTIRGSKTDQLRRGYVAVMTAVDGGEADPLRLVQDIFSALPTLDPQYPLMTVRGDGGALRAITCGEATRMVKALAVLQGQDPDLFGTHSMRVGGATTLAHAGEPARIIKKAGRWRSDAFMIYVRDNMADFARISRALAGSTSVAVATIPRP